MAENKTRATQASVESYLDAIDDEARRQDCRALIDLMSTATGHPPAMWGPAIVGFGSYHYRYESGREGDMCLVGFSSRKADISVYLTADSPEQAQLLSQLGRHKMAKACLHIRKLVDVDVSVLSRLVASAATAVERRHG